MRQSRCIHQSKVVDETLGQRSPLGSYQKRGSATYIPGTNNKEIRLNYWPVTLEAPAAVNGKLLST
jgi:hypothetical protein